MRGFAQVLFNVLLGWIRTLVEGVWDILFSSETQQWLVWIGDNWKVLVVFLCLCGVALDYIIWFFRWRPYYVWGASMRRVRRIFGGGRKEAIQDDHQEERAYRRRYSIEEPVQEMAESEALYDPVYDVADEYPAYEEPVYYENQSAEQMWEEQPAEYTQQLQETKWGQKTVAAADTIYARPQQEDYQDQYVRRFARPEPEPMPEPAWEPEQQHEWAAETESFEPAQQEEYWAPEMPQEAGNEPIHPGIDYQAMSLQYGWHVETNKQEVYASAMQTAKKQAPVAAQESNDTWEFSGLENFSPYRAPQTPKDYESRAEKSKKGKPAEAPLSKVRSGLSRIAQRAGKVLTVDDEQSGKLIDGLPPPIDKRRAFHAPVYPSRTGGQKPSNPDFQEDD